MSSSDYARREMEKTVELVRAMVAQPELLRTIERVAARCADSIARGNKIMFCGNGGSAADSQHLAAELIGKLVFPRPAMAGLALTTDTSALTAIGNDFGFEYVFARQVEGVGRPGDVLVGLSTSGKSRNVALAFQAARERSIVTVAMTGQARGPLAELADEWLAIPHGETQKIQEGHIIVGHIFCALIEAQLHGQDERRS